MYIPMRPSMKRATLALILTLQNLHSTHAALTSQQHPFVNTPQAPSLEIRAPTAADAAGMATAMLDAFWDTPHVVYMNQFRDAYPDDAFNCFNASISLQIRIGMPPGTRVMLGVVDGEGVDAGRRVVTSVAVWQYGRRVREDCHQQQQKQREDDASAHRASSSSSLLPPFVPFLGAVQDPSLYGELDACLNRRDVNRTREAYFLDQLRSKQDRCLDDIPKDSQLYLHTIGTVRRYQGRDIAGELLREGLAFARDGRDVERDVSESSGKGNVERDSGGKDGLWATLSATEAGEPLYFENGYHSRANVSIPTMEGDDAFRFDVMLRRLD
jgi:hypothetical protein